MMVFKILSAVAVSAALALIPEAASASAAPPPGCVQHVFAEGSSGSCVRWIQQAVNFNNTAYHWHGPVRVDGSYGPATRSAVTAFQKGCDKAFYLYPGRAGYMSGGVVGRYTWNGLETDCFQG